MWRCAFSLIWLGVNADYLCLQSELQIPVSQGLALFMKIVRKITSKLQDIQKAAISASLPEPSSQTSRMHQSKDAPASAASEQSEAESSEDEGTEEKEKTAKEHRGEDALTEEQRIFKEKQREMIQSLDLSK